MASKMGFPGMEVRLTIALLVLFFAIFEDRSGISLLIIVSYSVPRPIKLIDIGLAITLSVPLAVMGASHWGAWISVTCLPK